MGTEKQVISTHTCNGVVRGRAYASQAPMQNTNRKPWYSTVIEVIGLGIALAFASGLVYIVVLALNH